MDKKKIFIGLGVVGVAALGYYAYTKSRSVNSSQTTAILPSLIPQQTTQQISSGQSTVNSGLSAYEGKGFRNTDDGKIYLVKGGILRHMTSPEVMQRELGSNNYQQLVNAGVITQVNTSFIKQFTVGAALNGFALSPAI